MRLTKFLQTAPVSEKKLRTIPAYIAGGSYDLYEEWCMFNAKKKYLVVEGAKDQYMQLTGPIKAMMALAGHTDANWIDTFTSSMDYAVDVLGRKDRVIWFLRLVRYIIVMKLGLEVKALVSGENPPPNSEELKKKTNKIIGKVINSGHPEESVTPNLNDPNWTLKDTQETTPIIDALDEWLSLPAEEIQNYAFETQPWSEIQKVFSEYEEDWIKRREEIQSRIIDMSNDPYADEVKTIMTFPDGSAWFDLNRTSCGVEGDAMGHCGNTAVNGDQQSVFSYRVPVDQYGSQIRNPESGHEYWMPHMTFIWNKDSQMFTETKGRGNHKPVPKYYPYIVALIKQPWVHGFKAGGHEPEGNFRPGDLPDDVREQLYAANPALMGLQDLLDEYGTNSTEFQDKFKGQYGAEIEMKVNRAGLDYVGDFVTDNNHTVFKVTEFKNIEDFCYNFVKINDYYGTMLDAYVDDDYDEDVNNHEYDVESVFQLVLEKDEALRKKIQYYLVTNYEDEINDFGDLDIERNINIFCDEMADEVMQWFKTFLSNSKALRVLTAREVMNFVIHDGAFDMFARDSGVGFYPSEEYYRVDLPFYIGIDMDNFMREMEDVLHNFGTEDDMLPLFDKVSLDFSDELNEDDPFGEWDNEFLATSLVQNGIDNPEFPNPPEGFDINDVQNLV